MGPGSCIRRKVSVGLIALLLPIFCTCQYNLVPNYSFELHVLCPNNQHGDPLPSPWYIPSNYKDGCYANACSKVTAWGVPYNSLGGTSFQYAKTGKGYGGINTNIGGFKNWRSYLQIELNDTLKIQQCYYGEFWVSLPNTVSRATNNIGILLTDTAVFSDTVANTFGFALIPGNAQILNYGNPVITDTLNWVKISGVFKAQGKEKFITLGNFKSDSNTVITTNNYGSSNQAFYYVDDVSVFPLSTYHLKADAGNDKVITTGDSAFIGSLTNGLTDVKWYNAAGQVIDSIRPGFYVRPNANTFYVLKQTVCGNTSKDTIYITVRPLPLKWTGFTAQAIDSKVLLQWQTTNEENVSHFIIQRSTNGRNFESIGKVYARNGLRNQYQFTDAPAGDVIYYRLQSVDRDGIKSYSEVRKVEVGSKNVLSIYPNPARDKLFITGKSISQVKMIDAVCRLVINSRFVFADNISLDVSKLATGVYQVQVMSADEVMSRTLVVK